MIRISARNAAFVAMAALLAGATAMSCSSSKKNKSSVATESVGAVSLAVLLANGAELNSVSYTISGNGFTTSGTIDTSGTNTTVSVLVSGIPAGTGYLVELSGDSTDGKTHCIGSATFDVVANTTTAVSVGLQCRTDGATGSVAVTGELNACPVIDAFTAAPLAADVNGTIAVSSAASDADTGSTLTYAWTATAGSFADGAAASTSYTCSTPGSQTLTLTVSDGKCESTATVAVSCVTVSCGNGEVEADKGEQCDPPDGGRCTATCQIMPVCDDGTVDEGECEPAGTATCDEQCRTRPIVCGDGWVAGDEECDPPAAGTCSDQCKTIVVVPPRCGDGEVNQPNEQCDDGNTTAGDGCDAECQRELTACDQCVANEPNCPADVVGCSQLEGEDKTLCEAAIRCMETENCIVNGDAAACYCGTAAPLDCLQGIGINGACRGDVEAAAKSTVPSEVATRLVDPAYPIGRAVNVFGCRAAFCTPPCQ